jgi:hypothetical protein
MELLERLAALVRPPRRSLLAYHGVLAPRARWRAAVVPNPAAPAAGANPDGPRAPGRLAWPTLLHRVFAIRLGPPPAGSASPLRPATAPLPPVARRLPLGYPRGDSVAAAP